jgi:hypothetical protein
VVHPVVFYNNGISTEESVKHNSNIVLNILLGVATSESYYPPDISTCLTEQNLILFDFIYNHPCKSRIGSHSVLAFHMF